MKRYPTLNLTEWRQIYRALLTDHVHAPCPESLQQGSYLGRFLAHQQVPLADIAASHHDWLAAHVRAQPVAAADAVQRCGALQQRVVDAYLTTVNENRRDLDRPVTGTTSATSASDGWEVDALLHHMPGMVYRCKPDPERTLLHVAGGVRALLGVSADTLLRSDQGSWVARIHPDDRADAAERLRFALGAQSGFEVNYRIRTHSGREKWIWEQGTFLRDEDGQVTALEGFIIDVDEHVQLNRALRESEQRFNEALAHARHVLYSFNVKTRRYDYISPIAESLTGFSMIELMQPFDGDLYAAIHPDDRHLFKELLAPRPPTGEPDQLTRHMRYRRFDKDGSVRWYEDWPTFFYDADGLPERFIGCAVDITEQLEKDARLRASEEKFRLIVENQTELVLKASPDGTILFASPTYCETFGKTAQELVGQPYMPLVHEDDHAVTRRALEELQRPPHTCYVEQRALTRDGWRWFAWNDKALVDEHGQIREIVAVGRDITARKQIEAELARYRATLEQRVAQRTTELADVNTRLQAELTERRKTELLLRDSEARFRSLAEAAFDGVAIVDRGRIVDGNPELAHLLQRPFGELYGCQFAELVHPDDRPQALAPHDLNDATPRQFRMLRPGRDPIPVEVRGKRARYKGRMVQVLALHDITVQKQSEDMLRLQRDLGLALSSAPDRAAALNVTLDAALQLDGVDGGGVYLVDADSHALDLVAIRGLSNTFASTVAHYDPTAPEARAVQAGIPLFGATDAGDTALDARRAEGIRASAVLPIRSTRGLVAALCVASRTVDAFTPAQRAAIEAIAARLGGVLERARVVEELRSSEAKFRTLAETSPTGIFIVQDLRMMYANAALAEILGRPLDDVRERHVAELVHADDRELVRDRSLARQAGEDVPQRYEIRVVRPDGDVRTLDFSAARLIYGGRPAILGTAVDITDRIRAEDAARRHQDELAHFARISTIGEMASGLAHELSQPMAAALYYARSCATMLNDRRWHPDQAAEGMRRIADQIERAGQFLHKIKAFGRKAQPVRGAHTVHTIIEDALSILLPLLRENDVSVDYENTKGLPYVLVDPIQIEQVVINLVRNGIEAMSEVPRRERRLTIDGRRLGNDRIEITIHDHGSGLGEVPQDNLYDAFFSTKPNGMGMGLSICRSIIEAHDGKLWAAPHEHRGAVFGFTLPIEGACDDGNTADRLRRG